jgi:serine/threonine-protein kinase SRPK3
MTGIKDDSVCVDLEEKQLQQPIPMKQVDADVRTIYMSHDLMVPKNPGLPVLCDFGSAMFGDQYRSEFVQPNVYRAPEVILEAPWTYGIDIWNVGCMV